MGQKLPPNEAELYKRCDEVLHYVWDPIGVAGNPSARDEYYSYILPIFALVNENAPATEIASALEQFVSQRMGLTPDKAKAQEVAQQLLEWRDQINETMAREFVDSR